MEAWLSNQVATLLHWLALPSHGLGAVFIVSFVSATLLPMGSEPAVFGLVKLNPALFWPTMAVATLGNTLGGALNWWMGFGAQRAWAARAPRDDAPATGAPGSHAPQRSRAEHRALGWLQRFGPAACVLSWLPVVGDPLCAVAGWLRLPFWPCVAWMALGKLLRYVAATAALVWMF